MIPRQEKREYGVLYKHIHAGWIAWTGKKGSASRCIKKRHLKWTSKQHWRMLLSFSYEAQFFPTSHNSWPAGPMARRLTTNQEIAGSIPASVIFLLNSCNRVDICRVQQRYDLFVVLRLSLGTKLHDEEWIDSVDSCEIAGVICHSIVDNHDILR